MIKGITFSLFIITMTFTLICSSSYAIFIDSEVYKKSYITAGNLDIDSYRDGFDTIPGPMFYTSPEEGATPTEPSFLGLKPTGTWAPGDTHIRSLIVYNKGKVFAILDEVKAEVISDPKNLASQLEVGVYLIWPKKNQDGNFYVPIPGDDTLNQELLNHTSSIVNPYILSGNYGGKIVSGMEQDMIEKAVDADADLLWSGRMTELISGYQTLIKRPNGYQGVFMPANSAILEKRGCLLAFVVHMRDEGLQNNYQGAIAKYSFTLKAHNKSNK